ncbi:dermonecrotic toxin domain-containing protein [Pseudomonas sp. PSKL.D1]|uniref:dermonecrotic toxin domain-containing protein n=1 Tax=Pseudomonas sp. PSKL.D1 TaxID=3029060 RepID=UPI002380DBC7|nr:DUF6543 domain-containing protein [Pseudomonas sp. PSKL.D1]WDY58396.1 hypothetical protein PVV54_01795 [Pseudomonas sp. PSKL.D1]
MSLDLPALPDLHSAVSTEFTTRPAFRQVASQQLLKLLGERVPIVASAALPSAEYVLLLVPNDKGALSVPYDSWTPRSLLDCVMEVAQKGCSLASLGAAGGMFQITVSAPYSFKNSEGEALVNSSIAITHAMDELEDLISALPEHFCQAHADYWAANGSMEVSRERWLSQMLRGELLQNLPLQGLDTLQRDCVLGLLQGGRQQPSVFVVEIQLVNKGQSFTLLLPHLLLRGERDEGETVLWCAPSSVVQAYASFDDFAQSLCEVMAEQYRFDSMSWHRYELEGDCFTQQCALLLECMLSTVQRLRYIEFEDVQALELAYERTSNPAQWFIKDYRASQDGRIKLPPGLRTTDAANSFAYQNGLFDLALAQALSDGTGALDDILDLNSYTRQRLREQMLADHPVDANYFSDDLQLTLTVARGTPGGSGVGPGGGLVETSTMSLTAFAIGNLASLQGATLTGVTHSQGQLLMDWLTLDYLKTLVTSVDIGAHYPVYVAQQLDDPATRQDRVARFAREWRCSLLFSALAARLGGGLSEGGLQAVSDYCRGLLDAGLPASVLMPLAFKREPTANEPDLVAGMYVLKCTEPSTVLLYRPLYGTAALSEFDDLAQMMAAIRNPGPLQDSILAWLPDSARTVYDNGGFVEPHLGKPIVDTSILPEPVEPASFSAQFWKADVDTYLYTANRKLLVELADRDSVSNAESRWQALATGGWLLFDVVTLLLRGPVATVAWLTQALAGLRGDVAALRTGSGFERSAAVVDLVMNASMALLHLRLPSHATEGEALASAHTPLSGLLAPADPFMTTPDAAPAQGEVWLAGGLAERAAVQLDFTWRGRQGFNVLAPERRKALLRMRSPISLNDLSPIENGPRQGLYQVGERFYVSIAGDVYEVTTAAQQVNILAPSGEVGPLLSLKYGQWRIDSGLLLSGGGPKNRRTLLKEENQRQFERLRTEEVAHAQRHNALAVPLNQHRDLLIAKDQRIKFLEEVQDPDELTLNELELTRRLRKQINIKLAYELKDIIDNDVEHDNILTQLKAIKHGDHSLELSVDDQRSMVRQALIDSVATFYDELASFINNEGIDALADRITVHPESEAEIDHYKAFRKSLESVVKWEADMVETSSLLDRLLEETLKDESIYFFNEQTKARINKDRELKQQIERRRLTAVDLQFRLLQDRAELSLDRLADVEERVLEEYFEYLSGISLRSAGNTHADLAESTLADLERIDVLKGVIEVYEEASAMAQYLGSVGGMVIQGEQLKGYQKVLVELKSAAEKEMAQLVRESELQEIRPTRQPVYAPRGGRRHLVRTSRGRSVLAEEVEVDGVAVVQQRDFRTKNVLKTFRQEGKDWVEEKGSDDPGPLSPLAPPIARKQAQGLINQVDSVIMLGRAYLKANEPLNLATVLDGHIEKLKEALAGIPRTLSDDEVFDGLTSSIERLQSIRRDFLTTLYFSTSRPSANSLRFLREEGLISIERVGPRKALGQGDFLDVYEVRRLPRQGSAVGEGLWEAHFHYPSATTPAREFNRGHLKLWSQRKLGRIAQLRAATSGRDLLEIYRGELRLADLEGVIEFV